MKFNCYRLKIKGSKVNLEQRLNDEINDEINSRLNTIEIEIVNEYLKKQEGKVGIRNLGNEMRYNEVLKTEFSTERDNDIIFKLTENRRSFFKVFIESWINFKGKNIYFFILESNFGNTSNLVDNSFIRLKEIEEDLQLFFECFEIKGSAPQISIIEMKDFDNYRLEGIGKYTRLHKKKTN